MILMACIETLKEVFDWIGTFLRGCVFYSALDLINVIRFDQYSAWSSVHLN